jgi:hypothetical protein
LQAKSEQSLTTTDFLGWIERNAPKDVLKISQSMIYGRESKYLTINVDPQKYKTLELVHLTDLQFGHVCCNYAKIEEYVDWILSVP